MPASNAPPNDITAQIRGFVDELEALHEEKLENDEKKRQVYKRARRGGFSIDHLKRLMMIRRTDPQAWAESEKVLAYYLRLLGGPHQVETIPAPDLMAPQKPKLPRTPEEASALGFEAGSRGVAESENPYQDPDLSEAWLTGWQRGTDALTESYVDRAAGGPDKEGAENHGDELPDSLAARA